MLEIKTFVVGLFQTNMHILHDEHGHVWIIDPACSTEYERQNVLRYMETLPHRESQPSVTILATHGHLDHLWGAAWACRQWNQPVRMHEADIPMAMAMQQQYDLFGIPTTPEPFPIEPLAAEETPWTVIHTPGHTPGSVCLYDKDKHLLLSGDTLFACGYGRTDLPGGDTIQLIHSLRQLMTLPPKTRVFCGHGESTTIGIEKNRLRL